MPWPKRLLHRAKRLAITLAVFYVLVVAVFYFLQTMLVFPGAASQGSPRKMVQAPPDCELAEVKTAGGETIRVLFGKAIGSDGQVRADAASRPTIVYFYGNGMSLMDCASEFAAFRRLGANAAIAEYVGYGMSSGKPSEQGCYDTAEATYGWLAARSDINAKKLIFSGWSLGSGVAVELATRHPPAGLMIFSAYTSMADAGSRLYPFLPVRLLLKHRFENLAKIGRIQCPIVIGHGTIDELVPFDMSDLLAAAAGGPVTRVRVEQAGHNDFWIAGLALILPAARELIKTVAREK